MRRLVLCGLLSLLSACGVTVELQTDPIFAIIPITSVGLDNYAEVAVDLPSASRGDIVVEEVSADLVLINRSSASTIALSLRVSKTGQATPVMPILFGSLKPEYYDQAVTLIPPTSIGPGETLPMHVDATAVEALLNEPRLYLIAANAVTEQGPGELGVRLEIQNARLHALVSKSLRSAGGAVDLIGL